MIMDKETIIAYIKINTGLSIPGLARGHLVSKQSLYATLSGNLASPRLREIISKAAQKPISELWPGTESKQEKAA